MHIENAIVGVRVGFLVVSSVGPSPERKMHETCFFWFLSDESPTCTLEAFDFSVHIGGTAIRIYFRLIYVLF